MISGFRNFCEVRNVTRHIASQAVLVEELVFISCDQTDTDSIENLLEVVERCDFLYIFHKHFARHHMLHVNIGEVIAKFAGLFQSTYDRAQFANLHIRRVEHRWIVLQIQYVVTIELVVQIRETAKQRLRCRICLGHALRDLDFRDERILDDEHQVLLVKNMFAVSIQCIHHMPIAVI